MSENTGNRIVATPKTGMRFVHRRLLDTMKFDGKTHQVCQVTAIRNGSVYYRPVIDYGTREILGSAGKIDIGDFYRIVLE
jgi:hypothetical protein